ncbi:hypothetical protein, partial [Actinomadura roseirufa]|uniref:hypothetical protein n=1 Tax=Actinomadura roseirufa TaxID=2094049 RepID=UPI0035220F0B
MDNGRVVEVAGRAGTGPWEIGSGYRVGGPLVLMAGHGLPAGLTEVKVRPQDTREWRDATVAWRGTGELDAALVAVSGDEWPDAGPESFGRITGGSRHVSCTAVGFPAALAAVLGARESFQLEGRIRPGSGRRRREHHITVADHPGEIGRRPAGRTRWSGYSGAAVFCGDRLTGLVVADLDEAAGLRLVALPVERLLEDAGFRSALGFVPDLCSVELAPFYPSRVRAPRAPSEWLRPEAEATRFRGREALLDELAARWCGAAAPLAVALVTGPAGQGKTRLAAELCRRMRDAG